MVHDKNMTELGSIIFKLTSVGLLFHEKMLIKPSKHTSIGIQSWLTL